MTGARVSQPSCIILGQPVLETEHRVFRPPILVLRHEDFIAALHVLAFLLVLDVFLTHKLLFLY